MHLVEVGDPHERARPNFELSATTNAVRADAIIACFSGTSSVFVFVIPVATSIAFA